MHLLSVLDLDVKETVFLAAAAKSNPAKYAKAIAGKNVVTLYEKPSTRTKISFELAAKEMGAHVIDLPNAHVKSKHEDVFDSAKTISQYADLFAARVYSHEFLAEFSQYSEIPVVNLLSDEEHPCQALADMLTISEHCGLEGTKVAFVGDSNNVCNSLMLACASAGVDFAVASPEGFLPGEKFLGKAKQLAGASKSKLEVSSDPFKAVENADAVYTDVWVSMGQESEAKEKLAAFAGFKVTQELMAHAASQAVFMHCLPAQKGVEVEKSVIEGLQSVVFAQAGNRVHAQKAVLLALIGEQELKQKLMQGIALEEA